MRKVFALMFFAVAFAVAANLAWSQTTCDLIPGPCAERAFRQAYAPVDFALGQAGMYAGYGQTGRAAAIAAGATTAMAAGAALGAGYGHNTWSALIGAGAGAAAGGLLTYALTRGVSDRPYYVSAPAPQGREIFWPEPKPAKPLDCRKPPGKRGRNEAACAAAEAEAVNRQKAAEKQACLDELAASNWQLKNGSGIFTAHPTLNEKPLMRCGEVVVLPPNQTINIFPLDEKQLGGKMSGATADEYSGRQVELEARVRAVNRPGFVGFVLLAPGAPEGGN